MINHGWPVHQVPVLLYMANAMPVRHVGILLIWVDLLRLSWWLQMSWCQISTRPSAANIVIWLRLYSHIASYWSLIHQVISFIWERSEIHWFLRYRRADFMIEIAHYDVPKWYDDVCANGMYLMHGWEIICMGYLLQGAIIQPCLWMLAILASMRRLSKWRLKSRVISRHYEEKYVIHRAVSILPL